MRASYYKQFVGKRIEWEYAHDRNRGTYMVRQGTVEDVQGKNMWVDGDVMWGEDLKNIKVIEENDESK